MGFGAFSLRSMRLRVLLSLKIPTSLGGLVAYAYIVLASIVMSHIAMACIIMAYKVVAYIVMAS